MTTVVVYVNAVLQQRIATEFEMHRSIGFNASPEIIEGIDQRVVERRRKHPEIVFTRAAFLKEAALRALAREILEEYEEEFGPPLPPRHQH